MAEQTFNDRVIEQYRATGGAVTMLYEDSTLVLVTMRGARSGREITLPLEFMEWDGVLHIVRHQIGCARPTPAGTTTCWRTRTSPSSTGARRSARALACSSADERDRMWRRWSS